MSFHWTNIISLDSSQNNAFEELVCQLAKNEPIENKKDYIKIGNPDGGVECYIVLENSDEIGFQAKWFLSTPQESQFSQIEKSFKTALKKHPKMVKYYVTIPLDRADPRIDVRQSFMDRWNEKVEKWKRIAKDEYGRDIEIEYWGSSELIERLSKEENIGIKKFFFNEIDLSDRWFENQNELAIKSLGARYTPEVNVELDLVDNFNALSRNSLFKEKIDSFYHDFMLKLRDFVSNCYTDTKIQGNLEEIGSLTSEIEHNYFNFSEYIEGTSHLDIKELKINLRKVQDVLYDLFKYLNALNKKVIQEKETKTHQGYRTSTSFDYSIGKIRDAPGALNEFIDVLNQPFMRFVNKPYMILKGEAGVGKSHLLADIVKHRLEDGYNSIFLLGQHFRQDKAPWSQILDDILRLKFNEDEFLSALNAKAEATQKRIIIVIDAINEGKGRSFWKDFLIGFIESIKKYEWLGVVLSIRSSYFDYIIPDEIKNDDSVTEITHNGFEDIEYDASKKIFEYYKIEQPSIPLLHPEFSNPLFLKLFCEGLQKRGLTKVPQGYEGITNIIKFFIEGIENKLLSKYPAIKRLEILDKIIGFLILETLKRQDISYKYAYEKVEEIASKYRLESGLLDHLISEGLLLKNYTYDYKTKEYQEVVYFAYGRFEDHLKGKYLLDKYLDKDNPKDSFEKEPLKNFFDKKNIYRNRGIIDAISIQLPEVANVEIIDVVPQNGIIVESFFYSLPWRKSESISGKTVERILKNIDNESIQKKIFETFLLTASNPRHPLNAFTMHSYLKNFTMRDRDVWFIPLLSDIYLDYGANPINRLIDWAWSDDSKDYVLDDSLLLVAITLSWFLTSSNRKLRDYSTKALISILTDRVNVVIDLLKTFEDVEELYIQERLYAVAFGVVTRSENSENFKELAEYIYATIFDKEEVIPHITIRDYAKSCIEYIDYLGIELDFDMEKIKPPYKSFFPKMEDLPTNEEIDKYQDRDKNYHNSRIISSMATEYGGGMYGDFGRYVFGSKMSDFIEPKNQQPISNYATKKIFEVYGYDGEFFDKAEKSIQEHNRYNYDRHTHKIERIGKKYQWIAMYETLARVADNFKIRDKRSGFGEDKKYIDYEGTYQIYARDIDPTILLKETKGSWYEDADNKNWWGIKSNIQWKMDNKEWIDSFDDLPSPVKSIYFKDDNGQDWIALKSHTEWKEPIKKGIDRATITYKQVWYMLNSYLIPNSQKDEFEKWAKEQNFWNDWMPNFREQYQLFFREFFWSDTYIFFKIHITVAV